MGTGITQAQQEGTKSLWTRTFSLLSPLLTELSEPSPDQKVSRVMSGIINVYFLQVKLQKEVRISQLLAQSSTVNEKAPVQSARKCRECCVCAVTLQEMPCDTLQWHLGRRDSWRTSRHCRLHRSKHCGFPAKPGAPPALQALHLAEILIWEWCPIHWCSWKANFLVFEGNPLVVLGWQHPQMLC